MFFLFIFITIFILILVIHTSRIGIEIENLRIDTDKPKGQKINEESNVYIYLLIFKCIKLFKKNMKNMDMKNVKIQSKDIDIKFLKNKDFKINYIELIKKIDIDVKNIDLQVQLGTENAAFTAISVGIISAILGIIIRKPKYEILPVYSNKNFLKIKLDGIFTIYLMHYIYSQIFKQLQKWKNQNKKIFQSAEIGE